LREEEGVFRARNDESKCTRGKSKRSHKLTTGFIRWVSATLAYVILLKCIRKVPGHTALRIDVLLEKVVSSPAVLADKKVYLPVVKKLAYFIKMKKHNPWRK